MSQAQFPVLIDEVGLRCGVYGELRLRSAFQPIYVVDGLHLRLKGLRGYVQPLRAGQRVPPADFYAGLPENDKAPLARLVARLHGENMANAGVDDPDRLELWLGVDMASGIAGALDEVDIALRGLGGQSARLVAEVTRSDLVPAAMLADFHAEMRGRGVRLALDALGADGVIGSHGADIHKMRGQLFRNLARARQAASLIQPLVETCRKAGADVLVEGIETRSQLAIALNSGASLVQGFLLGQPRLAGTIIDDAPRFAADIIYGEFPADRAVS